MNELNEHLRTTRARLIHEISDLNDDAFNKKNELNQWSIAQVCHHLVITEILFARAISSGLRKMNMTNPSRKPIHLILDRSRSIAAPKIAEPKSEPFQVPQIVLLLAESRNKLIDVMNKITDTNVLKAIAVNHPAFDALPLDQWLELLYLHEQRHIEQIISLKGDYNMTK